MRKVSAQWILASQKVKITAVRSASLCVLWKICFLSFPKAFTLFSFTFERLFGSILTKSEMKDESVESSSSRFYISLGFGIWEGKISTNGFGCLALVGTLGLGLGLGLYSYSYSYNSSGFLLSTWFSGRLAELYKLNGCFFFFMLRFRSHYFTQL